MKKLLDNIILLAGIYAKSVVGTIEYLATWKTHTSLFSDFSRIYIKKCLQNTDPQDSTLSLKFKKSYGTININNSLVTVEHLYYNQANIADDNLKKEFKENTDGDPKTNFISNLTEIRKCL
jgi:hypothetical protein